MRSNTLRVADDQVQYEDVRPQLIKIEPKHFSLPSLEQQFQENCDEYPQLREAAAASEKFLRSRDWASADLPDGAIGWGALPWFHFINPHPGLATKTVIERLKQDRAMVDHSIKIPYELRRSAKTSQSLAILRQKQQGSIIILPIQLGTHHSGHSLSQVLSTMSRSEFCLGLAEVASLLRRNVGRLDSPIDLGIIAGGDHWDNQWVPAFHVERKALFLDARLMDESHLGFGVATGFIFK